MAHQLGGSLGLGVLVAVFAAADATGVAGREALAHRISTALTGGALMLALALAVVVAFIIRLPRPRAALVEPARG